MPPSWCPQRVPRAPPSRKRSSVMCTWPGRTRHCAKLPNPRANSCWSTRPSASWLNRLWPRSRPTRPGMATPTWPMPTWTTCSVTRPRRSSRARATGPTSPRCSPYTPRPCHRSSCSTSGPSPPTGKKPRTGSLATTGSSTWSTPPSHPSWLNLRADFLAGLTVAAISLPQSIAYALIAGVDPTFGLYAAIVFTAVAGLLGSSNHLVNGPTGAVSLVVFSALAFIDPSATSELYEALFLLAVLIGVVQILIAALRLGNLTRYISESVVTGFIVGAAVLTIIGQVASALGVKSQGTGHQHVLYRLWLTLTQEAPINPKAVAINLGAIVLAIVSRRLVKRYKLPQLDMLLVLLLVSGAAWAFGWSEHGPGIKPSVSLIESVPASLPGFHIPEIRWHWFIDLSGSAVAIAVLGLLEALAIAKAIAHKSGQELDYNRQIMAEGIGNLVGGFFRAMPGAGSLSRTAINYQAGAVSRFAGVFAALVVAVVVLALGPLTAYIPKAALAGLLIVAASRLIDVDRLRYVIKGSRYDALLLLATALAGVFVNIEFAILIGVLVSVAGYVPRASRLRSRELIVSPERVVRERLSQDGEP